MHESSFQFKKQVMAIWNWNAGELTAHEPLVVVFFCSL